MKSKIAESLGLGLLALVLAVAALPATGQVTGSLQITNLAATADGWLLSWASSATGAAFTVQFQDTLQDGIWRSPATATPFPVASDQWLDPVTTNAARLYRVVAVTPAERGKVLSVSYSNTLSVSTLALLFDLAQIPITPQYAVALYKLDYETITPLGARTQASGALALPLSTGQSLPLVSYQHGTITQTNDAPSSMDLTGEVVVGVGFASVGYAAAVPDYLGLGDSPGLHPYHHANSEATACVDMLRAVKTVCATNGFALTSQLFLCGYSEGGHATMALLRELEAYHTNEFTVTACAPMAGAYDLSGTTLNDFLTNRPNPNPYYLLYLVGAYQSVYHFAPSLSNLLAAPYNATLPPLLNGNTTGTQINSAMPTNPVAILDPAFLAALRANPRHPLRLALAENDVYRWKPLGPVQMYQCSGDTDVDPANAQVALAFFQAAGATQVQLLDPLPGADHTTCAVPSLLAAKTWFDSLR
jgi:hypothetical protein